MGDFDGLVALVTGRGSGIGRSAEAIACLAGPLPESTTGTVLAADGGVDAPRLRPRG